MAEKVTARSEATTPTHDTTIHVVQDPGGTPASYKMTKHNFGKSIITTEASSATPSINVDVTDIHRITALAENITSMSSGLSGTPYHDQKLIVEFTDNGSECDIVWGASFRGTVQAPLPVKTVPGKLMRVLLFWDSAAGVFDCMSVSREP